MKDTAFQHILKPITKELMSECTKRYRSDHGFETFKTLEHLQTMVYVHLNEIKSLRILEVALNSQQIGINGVVKRSTLSDANQSRPAECFFWILEQLMFLLPKKMRKDIKKVVKLLDSSPIQLKGRGYNDWTKEYATNRCQGLKLHVEYDLALASPSRVAISHPNFNDSSMGQIWPIQANTIYVFDKGYYDFNWWWSIHQKQSYFVTRLKKNVAIVLEEEKHLVSETILGDDTFKFRNKSPRGGKKNLYVESLRRVIVKREGKSPLVLVTNINDLTAEKIGELYKARWDIELFFKWVKQNLKLKKFLGKSENAVKIQLATAMIAYILVYMFKDISNDKRNLQLVLVWLRCNLQSKFNIKKTSPPVYPFSQQILGNRRVFIYGAA